jgi:hypothetical protein
LRAQEGQADTTLEVTVVVRDDADERFVSKGAPYGARDIVSDAEIMA